MVKVALLPIGPTWTLQHTLVPAGLSSSTPCVTLSMSALADGI